MAKRTPEKKQPEKIAAKSKKSVIAEKPSAQSVTPSLNHSRKLASVWRLTGQTAQLFWRYKKAFIGITLIYGLLNLVLAQGLGGTDVSSLKTQLGDVFTGNFGVVSSSLVIFGSLVGSAGNSSNPTAGAYQLFLALIASLAVIWALRQTVAGVKFRTRDAFYRGMYPLVPFVLVFLVVCIQLLPMAIGSTVYNLVVSQGIAVSALEKIVWGMVFASLSLATLYMISSSLFALYIVTLPDMTPMKALRSARELVRGRRWTVLRKILYLPVILMVAAVLIMLPFIALLTVLAAYVFFILTMFGLVAVHGYMYSLYRELLNE